MIWTCGIWKNVSEVSISRHFLSPVFPCVSEQKAVCGWKPGSGFPAEFVRLLARLRITGRPYAQHSVSSQASKAQHPQNKRRGEKCICSHSQRRLASLWRCPKPPSPLVSVVWTQVRLFCWTFGSDSVGYHIIKLYHENCKLQMIASLPHYHRAEATFWAAHIFPVLLHTHILSGRQSSTQSGKSLQISVDLDHFPENGLLLPTHTLSRR